MQQQQQLHHPQQQPRMPSLDYVSQYPGMYYPLHQSKAKSSQSCEQKQTSFGCSGLNNNNAYVALPSAASTPFAWSKEACMQPHPPPVAMYRSV